MRPWKRTRASARVEPDAPDDPEDTYDGRANDEGAAVQPRETPSPHGPWKHAARGTVPSPAIAKSRHPGAFARPGGTASPRSARIWGAEHCGPPGGRSTAQYFQSPRTATLWSGVSRRMGGYGGPCPFRGGTQLRACCDIGPSGSDRVVAICVRPGPGTVPLPDFCRSQGSPRTPSGQEVPRPRGPMNTGHRGRWPFCTGASS